MAEIKPAEITAILKKQLSGFESGASLEEVGTVLQVGDGIARVYGLSNAQYGELVKFENGLEAIVLNLEEDNVGVVLLGPSTGIKEGSTVKRTQRIASLKVGEQVVGRVVNRDKFDNQWSLRELKKMDPNKIVEIEKVNEMISLLTSYKEMVKYDGVPNALIKKKKG